MLFCNYINNSSELCTKNDKSNSNKTNLELESTNLNLDNNFKFNLQINTDFSSNFSVCSNFANDLETNIDFESSIDFESNSKIKVASDSNSDSNSNLDSELVDDFNVDLDYDIDIIPNSKLIQLNELIVHKTYGIGRFKGINIIKVGNFSYDCIKLEYKNQEFVYLNAIDINRIKKYGAYKAELDSLSSNNYKKKQIVVLEKIEILAKEIMQNIQNRLQMPAPRVTINEELYNQLINDFEHIPTQDQIKVTNQIRQDCEKNILFDRMVCGDVGYGKTEIAIRATGIFALSKEKYTVVIIVPTTILAAQHYEQFSKRFSKFGINVVELSRNANLKEAKKIIETGQANIIIGTHAILHNTTFPNLLLVIIDEEHKFGVKQKEKLKKLANNVNILALSATPIPRTLQLSLSGIKSFSVLSSPPNNRVAIKTHVSVFEREKLKEALLQEKIRNGKSFVIVPYIKLLEEYRLIINNLGFSTITLHGKMDQEDIAYKLEQLHTNNDIDVLIATPIVESGINILSVNTVIILHAENFGLSQLYQLRGRVGRSSVQGFAYIFISKSSNNQKTQDRLSIMHSIDYLNAGFEIANHDMQTRGFGNILGKDQSGHVKDIGIDMYQEALAKILNKANNINAIKRNNIEPEILLQVDAYIPEQYIPNHNTKTLYYNKIANLFEEDLKQFDTLKLNLINEMEHNFGPINHVIYNIFDLIKIKSICNKLYISKLQISSINSNYNKNNMLNISANNLLDLEKKLPHVILDITSEVAVVNHAPIMRLINKYPQFIKQKNLYTIEINSKIGKFFVNDQKMESLIILLNINSIPKNSLLCIVQIILQIIIKI
ncbi:MAG: DEAD/DEAH box helicase [Rickettsiales bacterium]